MSKDVQLSFSHFDTSFVKIEIHFPLEDVNIEVWVLKATVWKLSLSSLDLCSLNFTTELFDNLRKFQYAISFVFKFAVKL